MLWEAGCCMLLQDFTQLTAMAEQHCQAAAAAEVQASGNGNGTAQQQQQQPLKGEATQRPAIHITAESQS